jgi:hypothetical protein
MTDPIAAQRKAEELARISIWARLKALLRGKKSGAAK